MRRTENNSQVLCCKEQLNFVDNIMMKMYKIKYLPGYLIYNCITNKIIT